MRLFITIREDSSSTVALNTFLQVPALPLKQVDDAGRVLMNSLLKERTGDSVGSRKLCRQGKKGPKEPGLRGRCRCGCRNGAYLPIFFHGSLLR